MPENPINLQDPPGFFSCSFRGGSQPKPSFAITWETGLVPPSDLGKKGISEGPSEIFDEAFGGWGINCLPLKLP